MTSCVGSGCKQADTCGRNGFQSDTWLWCHSMLLPWFVHHIFLCFPCNTEYWQLMTDEEGFLQLQKYLMFLFHSPSSIIPTCAQGAAHQHSGFPDLHVLPKNLLFFGIMSVVTTRRTSHRQLQLSSCGTGVMG